MYLRDITISNNIIYNWNGVSNPIDGKAIAFLAPGCSSTATYTHGSDPSEYIQNVKLINNKLHTSNPDLRLMQLNFASIITQSSGNEFYATIDQNNMFRIEESNYNLSDFKSQIKDTTSIPSKTSPSRGFGITDYLSSIGEKADFDSFYTRLRAQRKGNWDQRYTAVPVINFVRAAFGRSEVTSGYIAPDLPGAFGELKNIHIKK